MGFAGGSIHLGEKQGCKESVIQTTGLGKTSGSWQMFITWAGFRKTSGDQALLQPSVGNTER